MKIKKIVLMLVIISLLAVPAVTAQDTVSSPSVVVNEDTLMNAATKNGSWILIIQQDLSVDQDIVLNGEFKNNGIYDRKLALYTSKKDHSVKERFTLKAPSITVKSPNTRFKAGVFAGDVYVEADNFKLTTGFTVKGNVYFKNESAKNTFKIENGAAVTGDLVNNF